MDTRHNHLARRRARGAVRPVAIAVLAVFALLAVAAWLLIVKPYREVMQADSEGRPVVGATVPAADEGPLPADVESLNLSQLLAQARRAMNAQRLVAPAGNNAYEYYLRALEKQPGNQVAADALRETFPFAATAAEQSINQRNFDEAQREIELLAKADPANYTLTILRSKLDAQRKLQDREQQLASDQQRQQQLAAQQAAAARQQAAQAQQEAQQRQAAQQQAARLAQQRQQQAEAAREQASRVAAAASSAGVQIQDAVLTNPYQPRYPTAAMRAGQEGWVEVSFTVNTSGSVADLKVVDAQPRHVFDRAALDAVGRWKFQPATQNGTPMAVQLRRRIEFKLGQQ
jgi:protein TonB